MSTYNTPLKHCPFCGSVAERTGGTIGDITITSCRCSKADCIASFKSVDYDVWNNRPKKKEANKLTVRKWVDTESVCTSGFCEVVVT